MLLINLVVLLQQGFLCLFCCPAQGFWCRWCMYDTHTPRPTYVCKHTHAYKQTYVYTYIHMYVRIHIHISKANVRTFMHSCIHTYIHNYIITYAYIHTYIHTYACMHVFCDHCSISLMCTRLWFRRWWQAKEGLLTYLFCCYWFLMDLEAAFPPTKHGVRFSLFPFLFLFD